MAVQLILKPLIHRGAEQIGIYFSYSVEATTLIKKCGAVWSRTHGCWYIPLQAELYSQLKNELAGKFPIDETALFPRIKEQKNRGSSFLPPPVKVKEITITPKNIDPVNEMVLAGMIRHLKLKAYSHSTIKTYVGEMRQLLLLLGSFPADELSPDQLKNYFLYCFEKLKLSENTMHSRINALKFYFEQVLGRDKFFWDIPRPKKQLQLPRFFSQEEIVRIIRSTENKKHRIMLMLAYSAGMRVSEVVSILTKNIDPSRMSILIEQAKGKKDRMVGLSPVLLVLLREYIKEYKPDPVGYLFPGQWAGSAYSTRSLQLVLDAAKKKAGILKAGSVHALRHSFATHLLDKGTDVTIIMKLMGHNDLKTTLRYLHVTNRDLLRVISPLDDLGF